MNCERFRAVAHDYYLGVLSQAEEEAFRAHAETCPDCQALMCLADELPCSRFVEELDDHVAGTLSPERRAVHERHLAICGDCRNYLDSYAKTIAIARAAFQEGKPAEEPAPPDLVKAILAARKRERGQA